MVLREKLLSAVDSLDLETFISFIKSCKKERVELTQILDACSKKQLDKMWEGVQQTCTTTMLGMDLNEDNDDDSMTRLEGEMQKLLEVLDCVVMLAKATIQQKEPYIPPCLQYTAVALHGLLLTMPEKADQLKNDTAKLFEEWWCKELAGRDGLVVNTVTYLLQRSLRPKSAKADVKRVYLLREVLSSIDMSNESSHLIKDLICRSFIRANYISCDQGCNFLSFVLSLNSQLTGKIHKVIKNHIPTAPRSWLKKYGEIYFRGWQKSSGEVLKKVEEDCIQDLMFHAVHASKALGPCVRPVLSYLHKQKKQSGVDEMLLRLYRPLLWRSFKVANPLVRGNAALLLIDAFPLNQPELGVKADDMIQKQFDVFLTLLKDPFPSVRCIMVKGIFNVMNVFWEIIPPAVLKAFLSLMIQELMWDSSSAEVRESVITGFCQLLNNQICHVFLEPFLPELRYHVHDTSEKVRIAMMNVLLKVKYIRCIKFWKIVSIEELLGRMEIESAPMVRRIVKLLFPDILALDKPPNIQIDRCVMLIESNPAAARVFFLNVPKHLSTEDTANFLVLLARNVLECIRTDRNAKGLDENDDNSMTESEEQSQDTDGLTVSNTKVMRGLIEAMVILWTEISEDLHKQGNKPILRDLMKKFVIAVSQMMNVFEDPDICSALVRLAGFLPSSSIPKISCLSKLKRMTVENTARDYGCFLEALCSWGKVSEVFHLVEDWLEAELEQNKTQNTLTKSQKGRKAVGFLTPHETDPLLGLDYVCYMLQHPICQPYLLGDCVGNLQQLITLLKEVLERTEEVLNSEETEDRQYNAKFLESSFSLYCKLTVLLNNQENKKDNTLREFERLFTWTKVHVLPCLRTLEDPTQTRTVPAVKSLSFNLVKTLLSMTRDMLLIEVGDTSFHTRLTQFCVACLQAGDTLSILSDMLNCLYQVVEQIIEYSNDDNDSSGAHNIPGFLGKLFVTIAVSLQKKKESTIKVISGVTNQMSEVFSTLYKIPVVEDTVLREVMASVVAALLAELNNASQKMELDACGDSLQELPPLTSFLAEAVCKKNYIFKYFVDEFCSCLTSGAVTERHYVHGATHLLSTIAKSKPKLPGLKECWTTLQLQVDKVKQAVPDTSMDTDGDVLESVLSKLQECQQLLNIAALTTHVNG